MLVTTDNGFPEASDMKKAGEIIVKILRAGTPVVARPEAGAPLGDAAHMPDAQVHEKALKGEAKSHTTSLVSLSICEMKTFANQYRFGNADEITTKAYHRLQLLDGLANPIAVFKFKYRSRGMYR